MQKSKNQNMKHYLCSENGAEFVTKSVSIEKARFNASMYGGKVICEIKVISKKGNRVEWIKKQ